MLHEADPGTLVTRAVKFRSVGRLVDQYALVRPSSHCSDMRWCSREKMLLWPFFLRGMDVMCDTQTDAFYISYIVLDIKCIVKKKFKALQFQL